MQRNALPLLLICAALVFGLLACSSEVTTGPGTDGDLALDGDDATDGDLAIDGDEYTDGDLALDGDEYTDGDSEADAEDIVDGDLFEQDTDLVDGDGELEADNESESEWQEVTDPVDCADTTLFNQPFEVAPYSPDTQLHPAVTYDGQYVWAAYSIPNPGNSYFQVEMTKLDGKGRPLFEPVRTDTVDEYNSLDPSIAIADGRVLVIWQSDTHEAEANMTVHYRIYDLDGNALMPQEKRLVPQVGDTQVISNMMMPKALAFADGSFAIAAFIASPSANAWQAFVQRIDADGELLGNIILPYQKNETAQTNVSAAVLSDQSIAIAWTRTPTENTDIARLISTRIMQNGSTQPSPPISVFGETQVDQTALAASELEGGPIWLSGVKMNFSGEDPTSYEIYLVDGRNLESASSGKVILGNDGRFDHTPQIAAIGNQAAVLWYQVRQGIKSKVFIQRVVSSESGLTPDDGMRQLNDGDAPGYFEAAVTAISENLYFAVWAEGNNPAYRLRGQFVKFAGGKK